MLVEVGKVYRTKGGGSLCIRNAQGIRGSVTDIPASYTLPGSTSPRYYLTGDIRLHLTPVPRRNHAILEDAHY